MNLTNFRETPVARAVELIRGEAKKHGTSMAKSELIGLIPQEALEDAAAWYLQIEDFDRQQVLERRMQSVGGIGGQAPEASFLDALASATPTPGGGSAAAPAGAL